MGVNSWLDAGIPVALDYVYHAKTDAIQIAQNLVMDVKVVEVCAQESALALVGQDVLQIAQANALEIVTLYARRLA